MKRFTATLTLMTMAGLLYVYTEVEAVKTGYAIRKQEEVRTQLVDKQRSLRYNVANLKSSSSLEKQMLDKHVELSSPKEWKTILLPAQGPVKQGHSKPFLHFFEQPLFSRLFIGTAQAEAKES